MMAELLNELGESLGSIEREIRVFPSGPKVLDAQLR